MPARRSRVVDFFKVDNYALFNLRPQCSKIIKKKHVYGVERKRRRRREVARRVPVRYFALTSFKSVMTGTWAGSYTGFYARDDESASLSASPGGDALESQRESRSQTRRQSIGRSDVNWIDNFYLDLLSENERLHQLRLRCIGFTCSR